MDNFMDKLAQRMNAQELIKANSAAEAMEIKKLQLQVEEYEKILQEMRKVNLKNAEIGDEMKKLIAESTERLHQRETTEPDFGKLLENWKEDTQGERKESLDSLQQIIDKAIQQSDEYNHKESVKVYRNVQAVVVDGLKEQTEKLEVVQKQLGKKLGGTQILLFVMLVAVLVQITLQAMQILGLL